MRLDDPLAGLASDDPEQGGPYEELQEGAAEQSADNHRGHRVKDLLTRLAGSHHQGHQADAGSQGGHQHGGQSLLSSANNHLPGPGFALVFYEMDVMVQQEDAVPRSDAAQRDETHHAGDRQGLAGPFDRSHGADERHR